uniref:Uncharacterized protein n=1 Tax=Caenorhabditis japonica TaxID=281687 RepID=A0A8R1I608_CAEJA
MQKSFENVPEPVFCPSDPFGERAVRFPGKKKNARVKIEKKKKCFNVLNVEKIFDQPISNSSNNGWSVQTPARQNADRATRTGRGHPFSGRVKDVFGQPVHGGKLTQHRCSSAVHPGQKSSHLLSFTYFMLTVQKTTDFSFADALRRTYFQAVCFTDQKFTD